MSAITLSLGATAFLLAPSHNVGFAASPFAHSSRSYVPGANLPKASTVRAAALANHHRAPAPQAFEGGLEALSLDEIRGLLAARGVVHAEAASKKELLDLLQASATRTVVPEFGEPNDVALTPPVPTSPLTASELNRVELFERVAPSVAYIQTSVAVQVPFSLKANEFPAGTGSGFVWDTEGHIITNFHVINGGPVRPGRGPAMPRKLKVKLHGIDELVEAQVVGTEPDKDLAVLKVDPAILPSPLRPLDVGSSAGLRVGQSVLAIGNPFGLDWTLTQGIVSALGRDITGAGGRPIKDCVQTDAAINPGNSGGPLLDSSGKLIGINTMIYAPGGLGANVGIGFAVPVDTVRRVVTQILTLGNNARPSIGVSVLPDPLREQYSKSLKRELDGALITEVVEGSPAAELGLQPCVRKAGGVILGDMVTAVNGQPVTQNEDLLCAIEESEREQPLTLTVMRGCDPDKVEELVATPVPRNALEAR